jgi:endonuclease/exonuclease/phosphatase family metal-dependent hydrolase
LVPPLSRTISPERWRPPGGDGPRIVTWNLRNFNGLDFRTRLLAGHGEGGDSHTDQAHDLERLKSTFAGLDADIFVMQEIRNADALADLLPDHALWTTAQGGRGHQKLGIAVRKSQVTLETAPTEHREMTLDGSVRPAFSAIVEIDNGERVRVIGVHLKAMRQGLDRRRQQWKILAQLVRRLDEQEPSLHNLIMMGDFNVTGGIVEIDHVDRTQEEQDLAQALAPVGLRKLPVAGACSAYWDGERRDAWKEATQLDFVFVRGLANWIDDDFQVLPMGPCARHGCQRTRSTKAKPDPDLAWLSDHCPLVIDLHRVATEDATDQRHN